MVDTMITLHESTEMAFTTNGLGALSDAITCEVTEERNGEFELEMEYPVTGIRYKELQLRRIIMAKPNPYSDPQPFRIYAITKPINGIVTINAEHISYDMSGYPVSAFAADTVQNAFINMKTASAINCPFSFSTDKTTTANMTVLKPSSMRSLLGGVDGSILDVYGGEYEFDKFNVKLWNKRGADRGVSIRYGKNLTDLKQEENCSSVYTGVYPFWYSEQEGLVQLNEKIVKASGTYNFTRIYPLDLSQEWQEKPNQEQLRTRANSYMKANNIGVPAVSLTVSFAQLSQSSEYAKYALLEDVHLCDTVGVEFPELNVSAIAKCIKTIYDAISNKYVSIELGESRTNLASTISNQKQKISETITKTFMQQAIENATQLISGGLGGYVIMHSSTGGKYPDEILIMDTDNIATAKKVWRWNKGGLGYSSNGYNGPFALAMTQDGQIVADFIATGELNGSIIKAGTIKAQSLDIDYRNGLDDSINGALTNAKEYADGKFKVSSDAITAEVRRATNAEGDLSTDIDGALTNAKEYADGKFKVSSDAITAEVTRATKAEKSLQDAIDDSNNDLSDFQNEVKTTFKDGVIDESEAISINKYLNIIKTDYDSILKEYNEAITTARVSNGNGNNISITFNANCETEINSSGNVYDYIHLYYVDSFGYIRQALNKSDGKSIAGKTYVLPGTELYLYWYSDNSNHDYYGFSIDSISRTSSASTLSGSIVSLPTDAEIIECANFNSISTNHPYGDNERKLWHYNANKVTKSQLQSTRDSFDSAYNSLVLAIKNATSDSSITDEERIKVDDAFTKYSETLSSLKRAIQSSNIDTSARTSDEFLEYSKANFKITSDAITSEVSRATKAEGTLKSSIDQNSEAIRLKVTSDDVESIIEQNASTIRLKASKISWKSDYSSMSEDGKLKCTSAELSGTFMCGSYSRYWTELTSFGKMVGGYGSSQYGYIDYTASAKNLATGVTHYGIQIQGGCLRISVDELATRQTSNVDTVAYIGATRSLSYISEIKDIGNGAIQWTTTTVNFENGLLVSG